MTNQPIGGNMMLVNSAFRNAKSFSLIPVSTDSPYAECLFDPSSGVLVLISKTEKEVFHMVPRLTEDGEPQKLRVPNAQTGKVVKEQRVSIRIFNEFYLTEHSDIELFINLFAINASSFDFKSFLVDTTKVETKQPLIIAP